MNKDSEQLTFNKQVVLDQDEPKYSSKKLQETAIQWIGKDFCTVETVLDKKVLVYDNSGQKTIVLLKNISYLGNPHPVFKKRIQLPDWYQDFCARLKEENLDYDVKFIGVYHYKENIVFADFIKDTYLQHGLHNSAAHIYINDLYQGMTYGVFQKTDKYGNIIFAIRNYNLCEYMKGGKLRDSIFDIFAKFNNGFPFGRWLQAIDKIKEMHEHNWSQWRQAEWPGWFLEYKFDDFVVKNNLQNRMNYVGQSQKGKGNLDFDICFECGNYYGDLKASDIHKKETPGNDQQNLIDCLMQYNKFWYIIYEHETEKDIDHGGEAMKARNEYIKSVDPHYNKGEKSYAQRMKYSVNFKKMTVLELNPINYKNVLKAFNQGHQPNGTARAPKFNILKKHLNDDNFVVFRYTYER